MKEIEKTEELIEMGNSAIDSLRIALSELDNETIFQEAINYLKDTIEELEEDVEELQKKLDKLEGSNNG